MKKLVGTLVSVHTGNNPDYSKDAQPSARMELDGFVGDKHRSFERIAQSYDPDPTGTVRRNERQWSGVSNEELAIIAERLDLKEPLMAATLGANVCVEGIPAFSRLARGSRLVFPSGAVLVIEEGNPPCVDISDSIAAAHTTRSGEPVAGDPGVCPRSHIFVGSKASWHEIVDDLPQFEEWPPGEGWT